MLNLLEIEKLSKEISIAPLNIIREYYEMEVLDELSRNELSERIVFYGGTAIRLAYNGFRFSEDLDFIFSKELKKDEKELTNILKNIADKNPGVKVEEIINKRNTLFGLIHISHDLLKHSIRLKIEISKKDHDQESQYLLLKSPTSILNPIINTSTKKSLLENKIEAIKNRNEPRDWFDFWYLSKELKYNKKKIPLFPFNKKEFENELKRWLPKNYWKVIPEIILFCTSPE